jgi:hypothetical protein
MKVSGMSFFSKLKFHVNKHYLIYGFNTFSYPEDSYRIVPLKMKLVKINPNYCADKVIKR